MHSIRFGKGIGVQSVARRGVFFCFIPSLGYISEACVADFIVSYQSIFIRYTLHSSDLQS